MIQLRLFIAVTLAFLLTLNEAAFATLGAEGGASDWITANYNSTHYSPLAQITAENAPRLHRHCTFDLGERVQFQDAPIVVDGVMYIATFQKPPENSVRARIRIEAWLGVRERTHLPSHPRRTGCRAQCRIW